MHIMIVIMALPILGLLLFYWLPIRMALPLYLFLFFVSALMYYGMFTVMGRKRRVRTGFEEMIGKDAVVFEDINPEGKIRTDDELWDARAKEGEFLKGERVTIIGHEGLTLIVDALPEKENGLPG